MPRSISDYVDPALEALNAGFASVAAQKRALDNVSRAFDLCKSSIQNALLADRSIGGDNWRELYYNVPALHNWKERHAADYEFSGVTATVAELVDLRNAIKAAPINFVAKPEPSPFQVRAEKTIAEIIERRGAQYLRALDLSEIFGGLMVSVNTHVVHGHKGAVFYRSFYYLAGEFTPLNIIIAAAEELSRRAEAA